MIMFKLLKSFLLMIFVTYVVVWMAIGLNIVSTYLGGFLVNDQELAPVVIPILTMFSLGAAAIWNLCYQALYLESEDE